MQRKFDLHAAAVHAMEANGFLAEFPPEVLAQAERAETPSAVSSGTSDAIARADMRAELWSSIDNRTSLDLDQIEWASAIANDRIVIRVGIADVAAVVPQDSAIDKYAAHNTSSVYTGVRVFAMLPERLSTDLTSLREGTDRAVMVVEFTVAPDGQCGDHKVYAALARNHAKLDYVHVGAWIEGDAAQKERLPDDIEEQLRLQNEAARRLRLDRTRRGSLSFETIEAQPVVGASGDVAIELVQKTRANHLIEDLMVTANVIIAGFLDEKKIPSIRRIVRNPERWNRIVALAADNGTTLPAEPDAKALAAFLEIQQEKNRDKYAELSLSVVKLLGPGQYAVHKPDAPDEGHFGLATQYYTHSTAPNRRFVDLVTQRLIKSAVKGSAPSYSVEQLDEIAVRCTERENAARKVERLVRKQAAAVAMQHSVGKSFAAIVTGVTKNGTYVRLLSPPVEGRVTEGETGLDVGDHVQVRLLSTDAERGYIDFAARTP